MRFRTTLFLLLVLGGLVAYLYWWERPREEAQEKAKRLYDFKPDDVTELLLKYQDREIVLRKVGEQWRLIQPVDAAADDLAVKNLVNAVAECEVKKEVEENPTDLAPFGLDQPFVTLTVKLKDRELPAVSVGKNTPVGFSAYARRSDSNKVLLVNASFRSGLDKQVKDLRDKAILNFADDDVQRFALVRPEETITVARKDGQWRIEQPQEYPADATTVRSLLSTLRTMRAVDFPADQPTDLARFGLDQPRLKVVLFLGKDQAEKQVWFGSENPDKKTEIYVQTSAIPTVYTVSDWVWRDVNKTVSDLRDKTVLAFDKEQAQEFRVQRSDGVSFRLVRKEKDQWQVEGVEGKPANNTIQMWIDDVHDLRGFEVATDHPDRLETYGLQQPLLHITVVGREGQPLGEIRVGQVTNEQGTKDYYAQGSSAPTVFKLRDYVVTRLQKQPQDFVEKPTPTPGAATPTAVPDEDDEHFEDEPLD
jgi:hypothetical protein